MNYSSETCQKKLSEIQLGTKCEKSEKKIFFVLVILTIGLSKVKKNCIKLKLSWLVDISYVFIKNAKRSIVGYKMWIKGKKIVLLWFSYIGNWFMWIEKKIIKLKPSGLIDSSQTCQYNADRSILGVIMWKNKNKNSCFCNMFRCGWIKHLNSILVFGSCWF